MTLLERLLLNKLAKKKPPTINVLNEYSTSTTEPYSASYVNGTAINVLNNYSESTTEPYSASFVNGETLYQRGSEAPDYTYSVTLSKSIANFDVIEVFVSIMETAYSVRLKTTDGSISTTELKTHLAGFNLATSSYLYAISGRLILNGTSATLDRMNSIEIVRGNNNWNATAVSGNISLIKGYKLS